MSVIALNGNEVVQENEVVVDVPENEVVVDDNNIEIIQDTESKVEVEVDDNNIEVDSESPENEVEVEVYSIDYATYSKYFEQYKQEQLEKMAAIANEAEEKETKNKKSIFRRLKDRIDEIFNKFDKSEDYSILVEAVKEELKNLTDNSEDDSVVETVETDGTQDDNSSTDFVIVDADKDKSEDDSAIETVDGDNIDLMYYVKENISKKTRKKITRILSKYMEKDKKYKFIDMKDGLYKMYFLSKNGELVENIIDPFATINGGTHPRIYKKAISPNGDTIGGIFDLTLDTNLSKVLLNSEEPYIDYNTGMNISDNDVYSLTVDFSNTPQLDKLNKNQLLNNVNFAINSMTNSGINIPKFRFFDLTDENHFALISDFKVKTPLEYETKEINGINCTLGFNKYIDNGRILSFNEGTVYTYYASDPDNKILLAQPQPQQPQPQQQIEPNQIYQNIMNNGLGAGFIPYPEPPITPNIITT